MERPLLVHEHAADWLHRLRRFPDLAVEVCADADRLAARLAAFRPTMAYSCKTEAIPGPAHRPLLDCPSLRWLHVGGSGYEHLAGWETGPFAMTNSRGVLAPFLAEADLVILHLRLVPETRHIIDGAALSALAPGSLLVNNGRGGLVDEQALVAALRTGRLGGAYLDVFEAEPLLADSPLWGLGNVILTPHCADAVADWEARLADVCLDNLERRLTGRPLRNLVTPERPA